MKSVLIFISLIIVTHMSAVAAPGPVVPEQLVRAAVNYWRDDSSFTEARMTIHRPDWERKLALRSWTKGSTKALVRFTAPAKDAGSATLSIADETWSYSPKVNKVIKIPPSMKAQSWMGSDFSYRDLTKADDIVDDYTHKLIKEEVAEGHKIYTVESIPKESAPVVWGKEVLQIRDDLIILKHEFFDQAGKLVKVLVATEIAIMGGKTFPKIIRIAKVEEADHWTEIIHESVSFKQDKEDSFFSVSSLSSQSSRK